MKKLLSLTVEGKLNTWSFEFIGDDKYLEEWRKDGLKIDEVLNTIPFFIQQIGLTKVWCWLQDKGVLNIK